MAEIFISYSRADRQFVDQFIPLIRRVYGNDSVWFDDDIHGGVDWWKMILGEIGQCDVFVYLISNESLQSPYCQAELREALRLKKMILPVIVRRLNPPYPGRMDPDLAAILCKTQYVDMSGGFRDPTMLAALYAALNHLRDAVPQHSLAPATAVPTPQPSVPDHKKADPTIRAAYIAGVFLLVSVVIAGIFGLWQGVFSNNEKDDTPGVTPTTAGAQESTDTAVQPTLGGFHQVQTAEVLLTQGAQTQAAFALTATEEGLRSVNATATAERFAATETAACATLFALSITPTASLTYTPEPPTSTPTPTDRPTSTPQPPTATFTPEPPTNTPPPSPEQIALTPQTSNVDWQPYITEREFDGVAMVLVPAGCFTIGSDNGDSDENNGNQVCFDKPFWIDKYEVTNAQYGSTGCTQWSSEPKQPRNCVNWFGAHDFCEARGARLPTEAEWEYAARGPDSLISPWGNEFVGDNVVYSGSAEYGSTETAPVGSRPGGASWVGALDMSGNVWEWTYSLYQGYPYDAADGREQDTGDRTDVWRVLRGGSFDSSSSFLRAADRAGAAPDVEFHSIGFRCARSR